MVLDISARTDSREEVWSTRSLPNGRTRAVLERLRWQRNSVERRNPVSAALDQDPLVATDDEPSTLSDAAIDALAELLLSLSRQ
jgi:hypothetical protein